MTVDRIDKDYFAGGSHLTDTIGTDLAEILDDHAVAINATPDEMQSGSAAVSGATDVGITFPVAFSGVPTVVAVCDATGQTVTFIDDLATTGCTINFSGSYTGNVMWIAAYKAP